MHHRKHYDEIRVHKKSLALITHIIHVGLKKNYSHTGSIFARINMIGISTQPYRMQQVRIESKQTEVWTGFVFSVRLRCFTSWTKNKKEMFPPLRMGCEMKQKQTDLGIKHAQHAWDLCRLQVEERVTALFESRIQPNTSPTFAPESLLTSAIVECY